MLVERDGRRVTVELADDFEFSSCENPSCRAEWLDSEAIDRLSAITESAHRRRLDRVRMPPLERRP